MCSHVFVDMFADLERHVSLPYPKPEPRYLLLRSTELREHTRVRRAELPK